jgi:hypothetical protein
MLPGSDKPKFKKTTITRASETLQRPKKIGILRDLVWSGDNKGDSRDDCRLSPLPSARIWKLKTKSE